MTFTYGGEHGEAEWLVIAAGRGPDVEGLGLDEAGVKLDERGLIASTARCARTSPSVYAIGDLVPGPALAHKASDEGIIAAEDAAGPRDAPARLRRHPARDVLHARTSRASASPSSRRRTPATTSSSARCQYGAVGAGTVYGDRTGVIKIVGDKKYGELLGGHIVGSKATELIQELVNVKALEGGYPEVARMVHGHPTLSEGVMEAARAADGWLIHG